MRAAGKAVVVFVACVVPWALGFGETTLPRLRSASAGTVRPAPIIAVHANRLADKYVFVSRAWDLRQILRVFNAVIVASAVDGGDQQLLDDCRAAGLRTYIEFDKKREYARGLDISATVHAVIQQVRRNPGGIAGIRIADDLNQDLDPTQALGYLKATGGVFHREIPGTLVLVDAVTWELTCGDAGQNSCVKHLLTRYRFERNYVLQMFYESGYVDGFFLSTSLENFDAAVQARAWRQARTMFPRPFVLFAATPQLSFAESEYPYDGAMAVQQTAAHIRIPLEQGADGVDLWAWHRPWDNTLRTFLNKDGGSNYLWESMIAASSVVGR